MADAADVLRVARAHYVQRQLLARRAVLATRQIWQQLDANAIRASWAALIGPQIVQVTTGAQQQAASSADTAAAALLAVQGLPNLPVGPVVASTFAGVASDGRDLSSLLELSNLYVLRAIHTGVNVDDAIAFGGRWLELAVGTQVVDAGRVADGVAIAARPKVTGYVRMLNPPSCNRCAILAGQFYRWNKGFERHPRCDCRHIPCDESAAGDLTVDPKKYFDSLPRIQQNRLFTAAGAQAIRDGADIGQVVNSRRGMYTAGGHRLTRVNARRYGGARLMPEQIYREAHGSREEAIRLLRRFGYIS